MEYGKQLNPERSLRTPKGIKGTRQKVIVTHNPSEIDQNQELLVRFPNLGSDDVIIPGTANLSFNIELTSAVDANRTLVSNIGRAIIKKSAVKFEGNEIMSVECNQFEKPLIGSLLTCRPCQNKPIDHLDNIWHQFTFTDDFFEDRDALSDEQTNIDFGTSSSIDNWKVFNKRGLHLIHLNINSLLSKIDELRAIAKKSRATVIGITESELDESVTDGEINIDGYELI